MNCMKCGRETGSDAVFCADCLDHMERHPVPPNTLVYVPTEKDRVSSVKKNVSLRPVPSSEDQIRKLNRKLHAMSLLFALALGATIFFAILSLDTLRQLNVTSLIGKNYTAVVSTGATD